MNTDITEWYEKDGANEFERQIKDLPADLKSKSDIVRTKLLGLGLSIITNPAAPGTVYVNEDEIPFNLCSEFPWLFAKAFENHLSTIGATVNKTGKNRKILNSFILKKAVKLTPMRGNMLDYLYGLNDTIRGMTPKDLSADKNFNGEISGTLILKPLILTRESGDTEIMAPMSGLILRECFTNYISTTASRSKTVIAENGGN